MIPHTRSFHLFHGSRLWIDPDWEEQLSGIGLNQSKDWTRLASEQPVSASYTTTNNYRFTLANGQVIYFKRYVYRRFRLKYWLQPSKAAVEAAGFHELKNLGIHTIQTLAYGEKRRFGLLRASFIVTLGVPNTQQLDQYLMRQWFQLQKPEKRKILNTLQPQMVKQLQTAHHAGFYHWDLKLRNILLRISGNDMRLIWIDCPRSRFNQPDDLKSVIHDLACMARVGVRALTPGQRMRFLIDYSQGDAPRARHLYRAIATILEKNPPRPHWQLLEKDDPEFIAQIKKMQGKS